MHAYRSISRSYSQQFRVSKGLKQIIKQYNCKMTSFASVNPLLTPWDTEFQLPPFSSIKPEHFESALAISMQTHLENLSIIARNENSPDFNNTIAAFDRADDLFAKVSGVFHNLCSSHGVPELQAIELKMAGPLAAHNTAVYTFPKLFERIDAINEARHSSGLSKEQIRLVERFHLDFVRSGAKLSSEDQVKLASIEEELAQLCTKFSQVSDCIVLTA
jgi:peptidyl-dipeptidase Dcp